MTKENYTKMIQRLSEEDKNEMWEWNNGDKSIWSEQIVHQFNVL